MESSLHTPMGELTMETDMIDVTTMSPRPDHSWRYTDLAGHEHRWDDGYPTLTTVVDSTSTWWCEDCGEDHDEIESHMECPLCGERIEPGMVGPSSFREYVPGRRSYWLNGEPISEERAKEIAAAMRRAKEM